MSIHNFITRVQNSNEATKRFWVVAFSGTSMLLVLALWLGYLNVAIAPIPGPIQASGTRQRALVTSGSEATIEKPGFFAVFAAGVKIIFDGAKEKFLTKKDIIIKSPEQNFVAENIEPITGARLP